MEVWMINLDGNNFPITSLMIGRHHSNFPAFPLTDEPRQLGCAASMDCLGFFWKLGILPIEISDVFDVSCRFVYPILGTKEYNHPYGSRDVLPQAPMS